MLHWVDLIIIGLISLSILSGLVRGFMKECIALLVWILALWLAFTYADSLSPWLEKYLKDKTARTIAGFIIILLAVLVAGGLINTILGFILKHSGLSGTDRLLGMGFGFIRGVFIVSLLILVIQMTSLPYQNYAKESQLYLRFLPLVNWLSGFMPGFIQQVKEFDKTLEPLKEKEKLSLDLKKLAPEFEFSDA